MKSIIRILVLSLLLPAAVQASHEIAIDEQQMQRLGIALAPVAPAPSVSSERLPARVVIPPRQERVVTAPHGGLVTGLEAAAGDAVSTGQVLARVQSPDLVGLQRELLQAVTESELVQSDLARDRQLFEEGIIAERRYLETRSRAQQAAAALAERRQVLALSGMSEQSIADLERGRKLTSTLEVTAPMDGVVLEAMVVAGQRVDRTEPLYRIAYLEPLWLEVRLPVDRAGSVQVGGAVATPCEGASARLINIGHEADPSSQTVLARAEVSAVQGCLRPGQFLEVRLSLPSAQERFRVPAAAVVRTGEQTVVFVREPAGFAPRPVSVLSEQDGRAVISGAVLAGESVAVSGIASIKAAWLGIGGGE